MVGKLIRQFGELLFYGNIWISLGAAAFTFQSFIFLEIPFDFEIILMIFLATLGSYNFQRVMRFSGGQKVGSDRHLWIYDNLKILQLMVLISIVGAATLFVRKFGWVDVLFVLPLILIGFFYAFTFHPEKSGLRDIPYLKINLIAFSWATVAVGIPVHFHYVYYENALVLWVMDYLFVVGITIPFDIRDLQYDHEQKKTIPQIFGVRKAVLLSVILVLITGMISILYFPAYPEYLLVYFISALVVGLTKESRGELFFIVLIDGLLLLFPFVFILKQLFS